MAQPQFELGVFRKYRAITEFHVGAIESNLYEGEVIETDGATLKRGGQQHAVPTIRAAIKVGWLVPEGEEGGTYRPLPAGVQIHTADPKGAKDRGPAKRMVIVEDEHRSVGTLDEVRAKGGAKAPPTHIAGKAADEYQSQKKHPTTSGFNADLVTETAAGQEGRIISKLKNPAQARAVDLSKGEDHQARSRIAASSGQQVEPVATGDVQEARAGDDLEDLLPDAASSGTPAGGEGGEGGKETADDRAERLAQAAQDAADRRAARTGQAAVASEGATVSASGYMKVPEATVSHPQVNVPKATVTSGMTSVGGAEDGTVVGSVNRAEREAAAAEAAADTLFEDPPELDEVEAEAAGELDEEPDLTVSEKQLLAAKIEGIRALLPGFKWDVEAHWATRVKTAIEEYKDNMPYMNAILAVETETVKRHIMKRLYG